MNNKGQVGVGVILGIVIGALVCLILFQSFAANIEKSTKSTTLNETFIAPTADTWKDLVGQELLGTPIVLNNTDKTVVPTTNYSIAEGVSALDGLKRIRIMIFNGTPNYQAANVTIMYTYGREGYIDDSGGRAVAGIILILAAIALIIFVLYPVIKERFF